MNLTMILLSTHSLSQCMSTIMKKKTTVLCMDYYMKALTILIMDTTLNQSDSFTMVGRGVWAVFKILLIMWINSHTTVSPVQNTSILSTCLTVDTRASFHQATVEARATVNLSTALSLMEISSIQCVLSITSQVAAAFVKLSVQMACQQPTCIRSAMFASKMKSTIIT